MAFEFRTARGAYRLSMAGAPESGQDSLIFPISMERQDGIERVVFRVRVARELMSSEAQMDQNILLARIGPWVQREFEHIREEALKSIRAERRLMECSFDDTQS